MATTQSPGPSGPGDEVGALLDQAEVYLSLAGEPETRTEMLIHAQTAAMIGLLKALGTERPAADAMVRLSNPVPNHVRTIASESGIEVTSLALAMREVVRLDPMWETKRIAAIKRLRPIAGLSLKQAKDIIDISIDVSPGWWN